MNDCVIREEKMKRLRPKKIVFAIPELIGLGSFIVAFATYVLLIFYLSACAEKQSVSPMIITPNNPYYGKSRKPELNPYEVSRGRNTGGPNKYYGYRIR